MKQELSILIPTYNGDCRRLVEELSRQAVDVGGLRYEIIVADDGSTDRRFVEWCKEVERLPETHFIDHGKNVGRAAIRNFLASQARYNWLLFLDCDMTIVSPHFLQNYLETDETAPVTYGGYVVGQGERTCLRYIYERQCEPQHRAEERRKRPFLHFHTCNFLVRRDVMLEHPFDERFRHYGYEDVLFGKQLQRAGISVTHLDNPVGFCTFEDNPHFVSKTEEGLRTLHQFNQELRGYSQMITFTDGIHLGSVRKAICLLHRLISPFARRNLCGKRPNLRLFRIYKLGYYLTLTKND